MSDLEALVLSHKFHVDVCESLNCANSCDEVCRICIVMDMLRDNFQLNHKTKLVIWVLAWEYNFNIDVYDDKQLESVSL